MFLNYTEKIKNIDSDLNKSVAWIYSELEKKEKPHSHSNGLQQTTETVKMKEIPCGVFGKYVKLNGIVKITNGQDIEYKLRGFIINGRTYYNFALYQIPINIKAQVVDSLSKKIKTNKI